MYFKTSHFNTKKLTVKQTITQTDSIDLSLSIDAIDPSKWSNLSVSILPSETKSYNHHNVLLSQLYIQPYVKGILENSRQYFENIDNESKYNLDLLMMTQGWSSYNWNSIFSYNNKYIYPFERGIDIVANINGEKSGTYVVYPLAKSNTQLFDVPNKEDEFTVKNTFPNDDDLFRIGYLDTKKKEFNKKPSLYLQFYPSKFPTYSGEHNIVDEVYVENDTTINYKTSIKAWDKVEQLDEVVVTATKTYTRAESLANKAINSQVDILSDRIKLRNQRIDLYLQRLGFLTKFDYFSGTLSITNPRVNWGSNVPMVYLDDVLLTSNGSASDFSLLTFLNTSEIDYIEYELYGSGGGMRGQAGFIKIYTSKDYTSKVKSNSVVTYDIPLRFEKDKTFYTPKYQNYNSSFFYDYGTIDWKPQLTLDSNGTVNFTMFDTRTQSISLFIEGIVNDSDYISKEIVIERNN